MLLIDQLEEYQRLTRVYRDLGDVELLDLGRQINDPTEIAQQVLQAEISSRRFELPKIDQPETPSDEKEESFELGRFASSSSRDCVWEFPEIEDAQAAGELLGAASIEYDMILPRADTLDMGALRLAVMPEDVERARRLLSQPIPEECRILVRTRDQFTVPTCTKCGSPDPLLDSIEPTNQWRCEVCAHLWSDRLPS